MTMMTDGVKPYYQDDHVTIYHGDCREIIPRLDALLAFDVVVTDPPYGRNWRQGEIKGHALNTDSAGIANDDDTTARDDVLALIGDTPAIVFGDLMLPPPARNKLTCVYHKADGAAGIRGAIGGVRRDCEAIYLVGKGWGSGIGGRSSLFATHRQITSRNGVVAKNGGHPHTKPDDVMGALVNLCPPGGVILDPFMGSGSTLRAAKDLGRRAVGIEIDERYCEIAAKRMSQEVLAL
jgi:site-specific DNA-methyltransferase (adenine-specific)